MGFGLAFRLVNLDTGDTTSRRAPRTSALVGRDSLRCDCVIDDSHVSKVHAGIQIRDHQLFVQDASSTNGVYVNSKRIQPNEWVCLGGAWENQEIVIGHWRLHVTAEAIDSEPGALSVGLASLMQDPPPGATPQPGGTFGMASAKGLRDTYVMSTPLDLLTRRYVQHATGLVEIIAELQQNLERAPASAREFIAQEAATRFPLLLPHVEFHTLLARYGAKLPLTPDRAALIALQDLSRAHVDPRHPVQTPREIAIFANKLALTLSALLSGTAQLFSGMREFEQQMDLRQTPAGGPDAPTSSRPGSPEAFGRALLDWRERTEPALDVLKRSFSSLMVHQVAMLNGVMRGVKVLLTELAPKTIAKGLLQRGGWRRFVARFSRARALWALYSERYGDLADEENERFRILFGPEFASEYRQLAREAAGARASSRPPPGLR